MRAERSFGHGGTLLSLVRTTEDGTNIILAHNYKWVSVRPWLVGPTPPTLTDSVAQKLMDDLWSAGIRPTDGAGSAGAMSRAEKHIADLQRVAFTLLDRQTKQP